MSFDREQMRHRAAELSQWGVFIGTSSWKYLGWLNQLYTPSRYDYRGKVAKSRFERDCLREYAEVFRTVCVDAAYYDFPRRPYLESLANQVPSDFRFGLKVTDAITLKKFPNLDRFGVRAGQSNPDFLNPDRFANEFLEPCQTIREKIGVLIFEFSRFWPADFTSGRDFVGHLDDFLAKLPTGWPYSIEMRNPHWLAPDYFACLAKHRVAHAFNSWAAMPSVPEQMSLPTSRPHPDLVVARFLLKPGRSYETAVKRFQPYDQVREVYEPARQAGGQLVREGIAGGPQRKTFIFVNNRLEGNSLSTISSMVDAAGNPNPG